VLSATYALDGCMLRCSDEPALPGKQTVVVEPRKVSAGPHKFRFRIKVRQAFGGNGSDEIIGDVAVDVPQGGASSITLRIFDDERAPASNRIRFIVMHARSKNPLAKAPAAGAPP